MNEASDGRSVEVLRHRTAIGRASLSRPLSIAYSNALVRPGVTVFDYGCGRGDDLSLLQEYGIESSGWDPAFRSNAPKISADVVNLGFVLNVIESPRERQETLHEAWKLAQRLLIVSVRLHYEKKGLDLRPFADGYLTKVGTFQKFYEQGEIQEVLERELGTEAIAAAPGIFFIFRDERDREEFLASQVRRRIFLPRTREPAQKSEAHRRVLDKVIGFAMDRGRYPEEHEISDGLSAIIEAFGSFKRAIRATGRELDSEAYEEVRRNRGNDLLVFLALSKFRRRPTKEALPEAIRLDVKSFFGSYTAACNLADVLLFSAGKLEAVYSACENAAYGKKLPEALYVHRSGLYLLPPILRVYEGIARVFAGDVEGGNILKINRAKFQVSYLVYPTFDTDPHPRLLRSVVVRLYSRELEVKDFSDSKNPPILHRKEQFVPPDYEGRTRFELLTKQEEEAGLFEETRTIGTVDGWNSVLERKGVSLRGHRLVKLH